MISTISELVENHQVIVCCGAGGVGKTTVATGLALAGARMGRRVLALTIDPSRRLADTLGVSRSLWAPVSLPADRLAAVGVKPPGALDAWMLDPQLVSDAVVQRLTPDSESARRLINNRVYRHVSEMVAGMQEYTAMEALHGFLQESRYDLVILDTPPSRNALDFLEGPSRLERFFDGRVFRLFVPAESSEGLIRRTASNIIGRVLSAVFGEEQHNDLTEFFKSFANIFHLLNSNAKEMRIQLSNPETVSFLMITSPAPEALTEALFFKRKTDEMGLPFRGFVLNRSQAYTSGRHFPISLPIGPTTPPAVVSGLKKLQALGLLEQAQEMRDRALLADLAAKAGEGTASIALPSLTGGADDLPGLVLLAEALISQKPVTVTSQG